MTLLLFAKATDPKHLSARPFLMAYQILSRSTMMLLPQPQHEFTMLTYDQITEKYKTYNTAKMQYWHGLQDAANQLAAELEESLQLHTSSYEDGQKLHRYIQLGDMKKGHFEEKHPRMLREQDDMWLSFAIMIVLEESPVTMPKGTYIQTIRICRKTNHLLVEIGGPSPTQRAVPREAARGRFADIAVVITDALVRALDPNAFP